MPVRLPVASGKVARGRVADAERVASTRSRPSIETLASNTVENNNVVELCRSNYVCAWMSIVALHCGCAVFLVQAARAHWLLMHPLMAYWANIATGEHSSRLYAMGVAFWVISALHCWRLLRILWVSMRAGALTFPGNCSNWITLASHVSIIAVRKLRVRRTAPAPTATSSFVQASLAASSSRLEHTWQLLFSSRGVFGLESEFFPTLFMAREVIEIVSQTFQARRSSELLPRPWLNDVYVALVVANCWSTPVLQRVFQRHQGQERVACLLLDALLSIGSSLLLPLAILWPYYTALDPVTLQFPFSEIYDALWFARLVMENQLLFELSALDIFAKLVPHVGIYASLVSVVQLLHRRDARLCPRRSVTGVAPVSSTRKRTATTTRAAITPDPVVTTTGRSPAITNVCVAAVAAAATTGPLPIQSRLESTQPPKYWRQRAMHTLFFAWGLAVLVLHVRAHSRLRESVLGCRQATGAWFATDYPCSVYTYNCYRQGTTSPHEDSWVHLDTDTLTFLTLAHCPALIVPRTFQRFHNLVGVHLHNVTVVEWREEHGISATKHPQLAVLLIARTNMARLPDGVLQPLPPRLVNVQITHTNLTALPLDLHERWQSLVTLFVEHSHLATFPPTLYAMRLNKLSLHGNRIATLPTLAFTYKRVHFHTFALSANPLRALPDTISDDVSFATLSVEHTQLAALPAWTSSHVQSTIFVHGTPLCAARADVDRQDSRSNNNDALEACGPRDERMDGKVPLEIFDPRTPL